MLTLFKLWHSGTDLRSKDTTWDTAFSEYGFSHAQCTLMSNMNIKYKCMDAHDDFYAQMKSDGMAFLEFDTKDISDIQQLDRVDELEEVCAKDYGIQLNFNEDIGKCEFRQRVDIACMTITMNGLQWDKTLMGQTFEVVNDYSPNISDQPGAYWSHKVNETRLTLLSKWQSSLTMLGCAWNCRAHLSQINGKPHLPFGGMNMIFAGDFAQLPLVAGKENGSLYSHKVCVKSSNIKDQQAALGKAVWHQVTTMVILHQNMRQMAQSDENKALRTSLINMRYCTCTNDNIQFLQSHCVSSNTNISIIDPVFHNVSIITAHNINKDAINMLESSCFTSESGQQLIDFFSEDTISDKQDDNVNGMPKIKGHTGKSKSVPPSIQKEIWEQPPCSTTNQIASKLSLCIGLPIIIKTNLAMELCITNGQEGHVYGWKSCVGSSD
ncbi:hypothetical protein J132_00898 [Termitomyces sp. J132]|nr:hypothetical protein J132_00898 [Termitomyces sp. J132]